ncbi:MAG: hypothetical protein ACD_47C00201G0001 [uncultured bacterium]|nr:MAG: hypothetical protein ACD_47C00201G0001 [uncultured bacterium]
MLQLAASMVSDLIFIFSLLETIMPSGTIRYAGITSGTHSPLAGGIRPASMKFLLNASVPVNSLSNESVSL